MRGVYFEHVNDGNKPAGEEMGQQDHKDLTI